MNVPSLPRRNRRYVYDQVHATVMRITEDNVITQYEIVELKESVEGACLFADALESTHLVSQAMSRATDPEYVSGLVAVHQARMVRLPDAREAA